MPARGCVAQRCCCLGPRSDRREAHIALKAATTCTAELNEERSDLGNVFGPTNVAIHQVGVAVELGNASEAMRHIPLHSMNSVITGARMKYCVTSSRTSDARPDFAHSRIAASC